VNFLGKMKTNRIELME